MLEQAGAMGTNGIGCHRTYFFWCAPFRWFPQRVEVSFAGSSRDLEAMGKAGTLAGAAALVAQVEAEYPRVKAALEAARRGESRCMSLPFGRQVRLQLFAEAENDSRKQLALLARLR